jgi:hypothetical protein
VLVADLQVTLPKQGYLLWAGAGYYASVRQATMASGLAEAGGGIAVRVASHRIVDSLGWLARNPVNQGDNASDFALTTQPTPGATNVIICGGC